MNAGYVESETCTLPNRIPSVERSVATMCNSSNAAKDIKKYFTIFAIPDKDRATPKTFMKVETIKFTIFTRFFESKPVTG
jgi:hypothetical protein